MDTLGFALVLAAGAVEGLPSHVNQGETIRWRVRDYSMPATGYGLHLSLRQVIDLVAVRPSTSVAVTLKTCCSPLRGAHTRKGP